MKRLVAFLASLLALAVCVRAAAFDPAVLDGEWEGHTGDCVTDGFERFRFFNKGTSFLSSLYLLSGSKIPIRFSFPLRQLLTTRDWPGVYSDGNDLRAGVAEYGASVGDAHQVTLTANNGSGTYLAFKGTPFLTHYSRLSGTYKLHGLALFKITSVLSVGKKLTLAINAAGEDFPQDFNSAQTNMELYYKGA